MRRREKFIIASFLLSLGLWSLQYVSIDYRYLGIAILSLLSYLISAWALSDDLQAYEWLAIVPLPSLYALSVSLFYFLLPENFLSRIFILGLFGMGLYALYLTSNIYSVAKGRTIQLLHAAHAVGLMITLLTSLLFLNTIFSLNLPPLGIFMAILLTHTPLIFMSLWSVKLESRFGTQLLGIGAFLSLLVAELGLVFSFYPFSVWYASLFIMSFIYLCLGILHSYLQERLFDNTWTEYSLVAIFILILFLINFPFK